MSSSKNNNNNNIFPVYFWESLKSIICYWEEADLRTFTLEEAQYLFFKSSTTVFPDHNKHKRITRSENITSKLSGYKKALC